MTGLRQRSNTALQTDERRAVVPAKFKLTQAPLAAERQSRSADNTEDAAPTAAR